MFNRSPLGIITMNRGDSFSFPLFINCGTDITPVRYVLKSDEILYFGVKEPNQLFENSVIRKRYSSTDLNADGDVVIRFDPRDTVRVLPGKYYYEIKIANNKSMSASETTISDIDVFVSPNLEVRTILPSTLFYIDN